MRVALCISGHFRTFRKCYETFQENILEPLEKVAQVDTFVSTWDMLHPEKGWHILDDKSVLEDTIDPYEIQWMYKAREVQTDNFENTKHRLFFRNFTNKEYEKSRICDGEIFYSTSMFYKIASANALKIEYEMRNNFLYDYVIRYRPDQIFESPINLDILNHPDKLSVLRVENYPSETRVDDTFFSGGSKIMDKACSFFYNLVNVFENVSFAPCGPESLFGLHLNLANVKTRVVQQRHLIVR